VSRFHKPQYRNLPEKCGGAKPRPTLCASLHACQDFTRATLCGILAQNHGPHFARACAVETHGKISKEPLYFLQKLGKKMPRPKTTAHSLREPAQSKRNETHVNISQEPIDGEFYRKNARDLSEHPDQAPAFAPTVRTPQCGHTVWGIKPNMGMGQLLNGRKQQIKLTKFTGMDSLEVARGISTWYLQHDNVNPQGMETGDVSQESVPVSVG